MTLMNRTILKKVLFAGTQARIFCFLAHAQQCERTLVVGYSDRFGVSDLEVELSKQPVAVTLLGPVRIRRILVLIEGTDARNHSKDFTRVIAQFASETENVPDGIEL